MTSGVNESLFGGGEGGLKGGGHTFIWAGGGEPRGRHRNEGCTIKSQMGGGGGNGGTHGVNGGWGWGMATVNDPLDTFSIYGLWRRTGDKGPLR